MDFWSCIFQFGPFGHFLMNFNTNFLRFADIISWYKIHFSFQSVSSYIVSMYSLFNVKNQMQTNWLSRAFLLFNKNIFATAFVIGKVVQLLFLSCTKQYPLYSVSNFAKGSLPSSECQEQNSGILVEFDFRQHHSSVWLGNLKYSGLLHSPQSSPFSGIESSPSLIAQ